MSATSETMGVDTNDGYDGFLIGFQRRLVAAGTEPLFTTDASRLLVVEHEKGTAREIGHGLFLDALPAESRQHYACRACGRFLEAFGGLVTLAEDGTARSVFWNENEAPPFFREAVRRCRERVDGARVTGILVASDTTWGTPSTTAKATAEKPTPRTWRHLAAVPGSERVFRATALRTAGQEAAERREEHGMLSRALHDFSAAIAGQVVGMLQSGALYRADTIERWGLWFRDLHARLATAKDRTNAVWLEVARAPKGFAHVRGSALGALLEDVKDGRDVPTITARHAERLDPTKYRRPTAAPSSGAIAEAEKAVAALGIAPAFARRYATMADVDAVPDAVLWRPSAPRARPAPTPSAPGVFDHLKPAAPVAALPDVPPRLMTWEKFAREVLPCAAVLEYRVPLVGPFCALTAPADASAPPILQWDTAERRHGVSWCFPSPYARGSDWSLRPGELVPVLGVVGLPNLWHGGAARFSAHGRGVFLPLAGARDARALPGGGFFPEHLRGDIIQYRRTIEAHVNRLVVDGAVEGATGFGIGLLAGGKWLELAAPKIAKPPAGAPAATAPRVVKVYLVVDDSGSMGSYLGAARTALASLLAAIRGMPGEVRATFVLFGNRARTLHDEAPLDALIGVEGHITGSSGGTALNDAIVETLSTALARPAPADVSCFLGIVTDGEENQSRRTHAEVAVLVHRAQASGRWTIAYAGAGNNPRSYARSVGIPEGNTTAFKASAEGFADVGEQFTSGATQLASAYMSGARSSTTFFSAAAGREVMGSDHPVFVVTTRDGARAAYALDRWE